MPSGPPELHKYWCDKDPEGCGDAAAIEYLGRQGYKLTKEWFWIPPTPDHEPTEEENKALNYLVWEWDFGGVVDRDLRK
jgi:hypothetical protein